MHWRISYASGSSCLIPQIIRRLRIPLCFLLGDCHQLSCLRIRIAVSHGQHSNNMPWAAKGKAAELGCGSHYLPVPLREVQAHGEQVPDWNRLSWWPTSLEVPRNGCFGGATSQDKAGGCAQGSRGIVWSHHTSFETGWLMQLEDNKD